MNEKIKSIFENLEGTWAFERKINNFNSRSIDTASGKASFTKSDNRVLNYEEDGKLILLDSLKSFNFKRKYIYKLQKENIIIIFDDGLTKGDMFQVLTFSNKENILLGSEHLCGTDKYNGEYNFITSNKFEISYYVKGSSKDLHIHTIFTR